MPRVHLFPRLRLLDAAFAVVVFAGLSACAARDAVVEAPAASDPRSDAAAGAAVNPGRSGKVRLNTLAPPPAPPPTLTDPSLNLPHELEQWLTAFERDLRLGYINYDNDLLRRGGGREERAPADVSYDNQALLRNFLTVSFFTETIRVTAPARDRRPAADPVALGQETTLSRWEGPILYKLFGGAVRQDDHRRMGALAAEFSALTGLEIRPATDDEEANLGVMVADLRFRLDLTASLGRDLNSDRAAFLRAWLRSPGWPCAGGPHPHDSATIIAASIMIRDEISDRLRRECFAEEFAQSMGLFNDSPLVRPSLFNDDQEFAVFTDHDALLMRVLYDPRLTTGMTATEAAPIAARIIAGLRPGDGPMDPQRALSAAIRAAALNNARDAPASGVR